MASYNRNLARILVVMSTVLGMVFCAIGAVAVFDGLRGAAYDVESIVFGFGLAALAFLARFPIRWIRRLIDAR